MAIANPEVKQKSGIEFDLQKQLFLERIQRQIDRRIMGTELRVSPSRRHVEISGFSHFPQTDKFIRKTAAKIFEGAELQFNLSILARDFPIGFHEVIAPSAPFYKATRITRKGMLTEALFGSIIRTYFKRGRFVFAQHSDGYVGYVEAGSLQAADAQRYLRWKNGECALLRTPAPLDGIVIPPAARLICDGNRVQLPNGGWLRVRQSQIMRVNPASDTFTQSFQRHAQQFADATYVWGGKTHMGIDCSGFTQSLMLQERIFLPRDASMQAFVGEIVGYLPDRSDLIPGDLIFFMDDKAHIFHVGVYEGGDYYLHSSRRMNVVRSSLSEAGENYIQRYKETFVFGRRVKIQ